VPNLVRPITFPYIPDRCHIIHCQFQDEVSLPLQRGGHSLKGSHYAVVLSPYSFNKLTKLAFVCPLTTTVREWEYEIPAPLEIGLNGVFRVDQFTTIDYAYQKVTHHNNLKAPSGLVDDIKEAIRLILGIKTMLDADTEIQT